MAAKKKKTPARILSRVKPKITNPGVGRRTKNTPARIRTNIKAGGGPGMTVNSRTKTKGGGRSGGGGGGGG